MLTAEAQQGQARCDSEERWGRGGGGGGGGGGGLFASGSSAGSGTPIRRPTIARVHATRDPVVYLVEDRPRSLLSVSRCASLCCW